MKSLGQLIAVGVMLLALTVGAGFSLAAGAQSAVLARVGNHPITERQVDQKLGQQLTALDARIYVLRKHVIDQMVADYVLQQAAQTANLSVADYLKREVDAKVPEPNDALVHKVYDAFRAQMHHPYEQEKPGLVAWIKKQEQSQLHDQLMNRLLAGQSAEILLRGRFPIAPGNHPALGPKNAPVTIVEFGDFGCPFTRMAEVTLRRLLASDRRKVRLVFFDYAASGIHPNADVAADAARCAGEQGKFWAYHDALLADQSKLAPADLKATAAKLKLDTAKFNACLDGEKYASAVREDWRQGQILAIEGTPTFFVNGRVLFGNQPFEKFQEVINEELAPTGRKIARLHQ